MASSAVSLLDNKHRYRFWAHILVIYLLTFYVLFMIHHEMIHFLDIRHGFLISKSYSTFPGPEQCSLRMFQRSFATNTNCDSSLPSSLEA
ncbi:DUF221-domain-containing protein [Mycena venus]|uniref:DUF221-domain-containing protein n=1 Tax=Mycena venus TaxID=2733690 RepID=A0A8H6WMU4_9AGAR|nr:DUF221-domain-containing protein [Mycena venus]